jgi:hypothetical protein
MRALAGIGWWDCNVTGMVKLSVVLVSGENGCFSEDVCNPPMVSEWDLDLVLDLTCEY